MSDRRTPHPRPAEAAAAAPIRGHVVYVHGLWLTGAESFALRRRLAQHGYRLHAFAWSSLAEALPSVAARCARFAARLRAADPGRPVHFVGHSLGGIVLHALFEQRLFDDPRTRVVLLGSPLVDCRAGAALASLRPASWLLGRIGGEELTGPRERRWSAPAPLGIIAGDRPLGLGRLIAPLDGDHDGTVRVCETRLPGATEHRVLPVTHTQMLFSATVARAIAAFLDEGRFPRDAPSV